MSDNLPVTPPPRGPAAATAPRRWAVLLAAVTAALLAALATALPARAEDPGTTGRTARIAAALRENPVYVDPAYQDAVPSDRQRALRERIEETGLPIRVALVPLTEGDSYGGDPDVLAQLLYERLGQRELILITPSSVGGFLDGHEWPSDRHQAEAAVNAVGFLPGMSHAGLATKVAKAVDLIAEGRGEEVYREATGDLDTTAPQPDDDDAPAGFPWAYPVVAVALLAAVGAGLYLWRRRVGRAGGAAVSQPFARPQAVVAAAREADLSRLRRRAEEEVLALGEAVQAAEVDAAPPHDGEPAGGSTAASDAEAVRAAVARALDAYAAAGRVLDGATRRVDLVGVLALVAEGRDALRAAERASSSGGRGLGRRVSRRRPRRQGDAGADGTPLPLCFFNPLHGRAARRITWRPLGGRRPLDVAACAECAEAVAARRAPEVLTDELDGRTVPYFEVPATASLWAATGYGSLVDDGLAHRVNRGDHSRATAER